MRDDMPSFPLLISDPGHPLVSSDSLHLLKRIRYRWVSSNFLMGLGQERVVCSTDRIRKVGFLSPIIFLESQASKMHDSLPVQLFSPLTFSIILCENIPPEFAMSPRCLLTAALTLSGISTRTRVDLLEAGFLFLCYYVIGASDQTSAIRTGSLKRSLQVAR
jgi:hypothetical protein